MGREMHNIADMLAHARKIGPLRMHPEGTCEVQCYRPNICGNTSLGSRSWMFNVKCNCFSCGRILTVKTT